MIFLKPPVELGDSENITSLDFVNGIDIISSDYEFTDEFYHHVKRLWTDSGVQECYRRSHEYPLIDCAK